LQPSDAFLGLYRTYQRKDREEGEGREGKGKERRGEQIDGYAVK